MALKEGTVKRARLRYLLMFSVTSVLMCISAHVFAQNPPPPPPPPNPLNLFKKHKKDTTKKADTSKNSQVSQPGGPTPPPPPPNPLKLFRKKKRDTTKTSSN